MYLLPMQFFPLLDVLPLLLVLLIVVLQFTIFLLEFSFIVAWFIVA
jgi:hypothetical protein